MIVPAIASASSELKLCFSAPSGVPPQRMSEARVSIHTRHFTSASQNSQLSLLSRQSPTHLIAWRRLGTLTITPQIHGRHGHPEPGSSPGNYHGRPPRRTSLSHHGSQWTTSKATSSSRLMHRMSSAQAKSAFPSPLRVLIYLTQDPVRSRPPLRKLSLPQQGVKLHLRIRTQSPQGQHHH